MARLVNILLAARLFQVQWTDRRVLVRCDNETVVSVLRSGRTRDPYIGACAWNILYVLALTDIDLHCAYMRGLDNRVADLVGQVVLTTSVNYVTRSSMVPS